MQSPVRTDFKGIEKKQELRDAIMAQVNELESRFGRITACRVMLKGPGAHHKHGSYEIHIRLSLPNGREVNVARTPEVDERHLRLEFAISDAFHRARRRLQDYARIMQGQVKAHGQGRSMVGEY